jgi:lipopolysaccharide export system protein LptA
MFAAKSRLDMTSLLRNFPGAAALMLLMSPSLATAQIVDLDRLPWTIDSETMSFDGKTSTIIYTGLQFSQGQISIEADEGRATTREQENSTWQFSGNVVIDLNNGHIECESAELQFAGSVLNTATVTGKPATFELTRTDADDVTYAEAGNLKYDVVRGIIEFSEQAKITESGNEISSNFLVYNILERRINADSSGVGEDRVRITYTPTDDLAERIPAQPDFDIDNDNDNESENP